jgi:hypothetical protein
MKKILGDKIVFHPSAEITNKGIRKTGCIKNL